MTSSERQWQKSVICLLLGATVLAVFWPAVGCNFVLFDDQDYVLYNKDIQRGLNWRSIQYAFTTFHTSNWHPLTWISHILDCQLYGLVPAGHHFTSLLFHAANSMLLFILLNHVTGALWRSAFVAAMFGLHPLRVESVVWISERKDVLSTFFWMLTVAAYLRYADAIKVQGSRFKFYYLLALALFACALMSKAMTVTLPCVLLLLDYWPLRRLEFGPHFSWRPVLEKVPFLVLAVAAGLVTFLVQNHFGVVTAMTKIPLSERLANTPVAYATYLLKNFWPSGLAAFYPHQALGMWEVPGSIFLLLALCFWSAWRWRMQPYLAVGWFWFLGMLFPTIGLLQVGYQSMADRYSYLPSVGLWIAVVWGVSEWVGARPYARVAASLAAGLGVVACVILTPLQERYWENTGTLFTRIASITDRPYLAYYKLGADALRKGEYSLAVDNFQTALRSEARDAPWIDHSQGYNDLGVAYTHVGDVTNAVHFFEMAITRQPRYVEAYFNMGCAFLTNHQPDVAVECFAHALAIESNLPDVHYKLANTLVELGRPAEAVAHFSEALKQRPDMDEAANNLAWLLATCPDRSLRDGARAVTLARQASEHSHNQNPVILGTLAVSLAAEGNVAEAAATAQQARQLALSQNNGKLAAVLEAQWRHYQGGGGSTR